MRRYLPFVIIAVVFLLTIGGSLALYRAKQGGRPPLAQASKSSDNFHSEESHSRGPAKALVTMEEFADFQCPACRITSEVIRAIGNDYRSQLRVIFRQFPLPMHPHGREAALAAQAAGEQGHFWEMHDLLYQEQSEWSNKSNAWPLFESYAGKLRLNTREFEDDYRSSRVAREVDNEHRLGEQRGVEKTPTIFLNNVLLPPPYTPERLREAIETIIGSKGKSS